MVEVKDERLLSAIAADFEGSEYIEKENERMEEIKERYTGFSKVVGLSKENADNVVRVTLVIP